MRLFAILASVVVLLAGCASDTPGSGATLVPSRAPSPSVAGFPDATPRRVTPAPGEDPTPTGEVHWEYVGSVPVNSEEESSIALAGLHDGYVAVGPAAGAVWHSPDAAVWTEQQLKPPEGVTIAADAIASDGDILVVAGSYSPCSRKAYRRNPFGDCSQRPVTWVSTDGVSWRSSGVWTGRNGDVSRSGSLFVDVWTRPGGWEAAQGFDMSDESDELSVEGPVIWRSADGIRWTVIADATVDESMCCDLGEAFDAAVDDSGRRAVVVGGSWDGGLWTTDATGESQAIMLPIETTQTFIHWVAPPFAGRPWLVIGSRDLSTGSSAAQFWTSDDLRSWQRTALPVVPSSARAVVREPHRDVIAGSQTWISNDGVTWRVGDDAEAIVAAAPGPRGIIGTPGSMDGRFEVLRLVDSRLVDSR